MAALRVVLVGEGGVGKSCLTLQFISEKFVGMFSSLFFPFPQLLFILFFIPLFNQRSMIQRWKTAIENN